MPRCLDLGCSAGGASMGYFRAGFQMVGVDITPQPNYPFEFHQSDAVEWLHLHGDEYDFIHASPPCQRYSAMKNIHQSATYTERHPDLIDAWRKAIQAFEVIYVIENVVGARAYLRNPLMLCGAQFDLRVYRHRLFESSVLLFQPEHKPHEDQTPSVGRGVSPKGFISVSGTGGVTKGGLPTGWKNAHAYKSWAMGIDWMTPDELRESIPPAFTEYIGKQLLHGAFSTWADAGQPGAVVIVQNRL